MKAIVPITFRLSADLKSAAEKAAAARRLSLNSFVEVAVQNETAGVCSACGRRARHIARGTTPEFADFARLQRGASIYVRLERDGKTIVYKGRVPLVYGRHLQLNAESPSWNRGGQTILLDEVVDWEPAKSGTSTADWDDNHPGIAVDPWGLR